MDQAATRGMVTSGLWEPGKAKIRVEEEGEQGYQFPGLVCHKCGVICLAGLAAFKAHLEAQIHSLLYKSYITRVNVDRR